MFHHLSKNPEWYPLLISVPHSWSARNLLSYPYEWRPLKNKVPSKWRILKGSSVELLLLLKKDNITSPWNSWSPRQPWSRNLQPNAENHIHRSNGTSYHCTESSWSGGTPSPQPFQIPQGGDFHVCTRPRRSMHYTSVSLALAGQKTWPVPPTHCTTITEKKCLKVSLTITLKQAEAPIPSPLPVSPKQLTHYCRRQP